jgi:hypothetical protein
MPFERMTLSHRLQSSLAYIPRGLTIANPSLPFPFNYARSSPSNYPVGQYNFIEQQTVRLTSAAPDKPTL